MGAAYKALGVWGAPDDSPLHIPALDFLQVRGTFAPVTVLLLVLQVKGGGVGFRGGGKSLGFRGDEKGSGEVERMGGGRGASE